MITRYFRLVYGEGILYLANYIIAYIPSHNLRKAYCRYIMGYIIGKDSYIFMGAWFDTKRNFEMGDNSVINQNCRLDSRGGLTIGNNVSISADVCILTADHNPQSFTFEGRIRRVKICDYVFIGTRAMILPGITLGKGSVVCAGAVVTKDVGENIMVAGMPARPIKQRVETYDYVINYGRLFH